MTQALVVSNAVVQAGAVRIIDDLSLEVAPGRIVAVVGANGAGKTTLLDAVCGMVATSAGHVTVNGTPVGAGDGRPNVGRVFQGSPLPETLTVGEVTALATRDRTTAAALMQRFGLQPHSSSFVNELSTGMRRILDLAVATVGDPPVLLLDEPSSGLAGAEVDELARMILRWRDETGAAILLVEHDAQLVRAVAEEVCVLASGRLVARGSPDDVLDARFAAAPRVRRPDEGTFEEALARVTADAAPAPPPMRRVLSTWTLLRLGLREFAAGLASVLILGVLNRVMKVELGISLAVVAVVLSSYNLAAPIALAIGHASDTRPIFGRRRTPYILGGAVIAGLAVAGAPHVGAQLAGGLRPLAVIGAVALFVAMGVGMYGAGTVFFALIADLAPEHERGHAASIVYLELMAGVLAGVALTGSVLETDASNIGTLFALAGVLVVVFTVIAIWGQDKRGETFAPQARERLRTAIGSIARIGQARLFFAFMVLSTLFLFLQQAVLEPYGGEVLGLDVRATSAFNALQTIGILVGMVVSGRALADRFGHKRVAAYSLVLGAISFGWLAAAAATSSAPPSWLALPAIGLATGLFNVAGLALMMGMVDTRRVALFMGAWTVAHAVADGAAVAGGGLIYEAAAAILGSPSLGYASVFAIEALGLLLCLPLLARVHPDRFVEEALTQIGDRGQRDDR